MVHTVAGLSLFRKRGGWNRHFRGKDSPKWVFKKWTLNVQKDDRSTRLWRSSLLTILNTFKYIPQKEISGHPNPTRQILFGSPAFGVCKFCGKKHDIFEALTLADRRTHRIQGISMLIQNQVVSYWGSYGLTSNEYSIKNCSEIAEFPNTSPSSPCFGDQLDLDISLPKRLHSIAVLCFLGRPWLAALS